MAKYINTRDMFDGGGAGRSGQRFEGGFLADIANALGIKPAGYRDRLATARPMQRPDLHPSTLPAPDDNSAATIGDFLTSDGGALAEKRQAGTPRPSMPTIGALLSADAGRMADQSQSVPFSAPFPTLREILAMDDERRMGAGQTPSFIVPAAASPSPSRLPVAQEDDLSRIKRQLADVGIVLPDGVLGSLLPTLRGMPRISQQRKFVTEYMWKNNLAPSPIGPAVRAAF